MNKQRARKGTRADYAAWFKLCMEAKRLKQQQAQTGQPQQPTLFNNAVVRPMMTGRPA